MRTQEQLTALENHIKVLDNKKLKVYKKEVYDKRQTIPKFFIQNGNHTISPALTYEELNLFILGMSRAKQIQHKEVNDTPQITRQQFLDYFRSDEYNEQMSTDDCLEVFATSIKGSSDLTAELFNEILSDYGADFEVEEKEKGLLHQVIHEHKHGTTTYFFRSPVNMEGFVNEDNPPTEEEQRIMDRLGIDYEVRHDESIDITEIDISYAITILPLINQN